MNSDFFKYIFCFIILLFTIMIDYCSKKIRKMYVKEQFILVQYSNLIYIFILKKFKVIAFIFVNIQVFRTQKIVIKFIDDCIGIIFRFIDVVIEIFIFIILSLPLLFIYYFFSVRLNANEVVNIIFF